MQNSENSAIINAINEMKHSIVPELKQSIVDEIKHSIVPELKQSIIDEIQHSIIDEIRLSINETNKRIDTLETKFINCNIKFPFFLST